MKQKESVPILSMILVISLSYVFQYLPKQSRTKYIQKAEDCIIKHCVSSDQDHLFHLSQFLKNGGTDLLPNTSIVLNRLLNLLHEKSRNLIKCIGYLIKSNIKINSLIFWGAIKPHEMSIGTISLISELLLYTDIDLPPDTSEIASTISQISFENITPGHTFVQTESSLNCIRWLIRHHFASPQTIELQYNDKPNLNALAMDCWAEYASYGDLSVRPEMPLTNESCILKSYVRYICEATKNPNFTFDSIYVPHWLWNSICEEFNNGPHFPNSSFISLANDELRIISEFAHILPGWIFVHAMRLRTKSPELSGRIIKIVQDIPLCILYPYFDDFKDFISAHINIDQSIKPLEDCLRVISAALSFSKQTELIVFIISKIDYFSEKSLTSWLCLLTVLLRYMDNMTPFLDVFDSILESFDMISHNHSIFSSLFTFFSVIAPFATDHTDQLACMASAVVFACFNEEPSFVHDDPYAHSIYLSCGKFYQIRNTDILVDPFYKISNSYPLTASALLTLTRLPPGPKIIVKKLLEKCPALVTAWPVETTAMVNHISLFALQNGIGMKELQDFSTVATTVLQYHSDTTFIILMTYFQQIMKGHHITVNTTGAMQSNMEQFTDDIDMTRLTLQIEDDLTPLLVMKPEQLTLLNEGWCQESSVCFFQAIFTETQNQSNWRNERFYRRLLNTKIVTQPPLKHGYDNWVKRELSLFTYHKNQLSNDATLSDFMSEYPVSNLTQAIKQYRRNDKLQAQLVQLLCNNIDSIADENKTKFWFLHYLCKNGFKKYVPIDGTGKCKGLSILIQGAKPDERVEWETVLSMGRLKGMQKVELAKKERSIILLSQALQITIKLSPKALHRMMKCDLPSVKRNLIRYLTSAIDTFDSTVIDMIASMEFEKVKAYLYSISLRNPILFDSILFFFISITGTTWHHKMSELLPVTSYVDALLCYVFNDGWNVSAAHIYIALPLMTRICEIPGMRAGKEVLRHCIRRMWDMSQIVRRSISLDDSELAKILIIER